MPEGIIIKGIGGFYYVKSNNNVVECKVKGKFRNDKVIPTVGDHVVFDIDDNGIGFITNIKERKNYIIRPAVSNIDQVVIVMSIVHPSVNLVFIDKLIAILESLDIHTILCINKIDLDMEERFKEIEKIYSTVGYEVINTSAKSLKGIDILRDKLKNKISVLAGVSGVGKSSLLNILIESSDAKTGQLSEKIERGKHTTRHVELFELENGGYILDTPGFSNLDITNLDKDNLKYYFKEFFDYNDKCKFRGCNHINEPGCAVKDAVSEATINKERYYNYKAIFEELSIKKQYK